MNLLTTKEVSDRLGVTVNRVQAMIRAGRLPAEKFGRDYLVQESDLALVANRKPGRPPKLVESSNGQATKPVTARKKRDRKK